MPRLLIIIFSCLLFLVQKSTQDDFATDQNRFICSKIAEQHRTTVIDMKTTSFATLRAYDFNSGSTYQGVPLSCSWLLKLNDPEQVVELTFVKFSLPEDSSEYGDYTDSGDEDETNCLRNYLRVSSVELLDNGQSEPVAIEEFCGKGDVPVLTSEKNTSVLIEVQIEKPFEDFVIEVQPKPVGSIESRSTGGAFACDDGEGGTQFRCAENDLMCLPNSHRCDMITDCPDGSDELGCTNEVRDESMIDSGCGSRRYLEGESGSFTTKNYPCNYPDNARCRWYIKSPPNTMLALAFNQLFDIEDAPEAADCPYDSLTIYSMKDNRVASMHLVTKLCGSKMPKPYVIPSNQLVVEFQSDESGNKRGFRMHWSVIKDEDIELFVGEERAGSMRRFSAKPPASLPRYPGGKACQSSATLKGLGGIITSVNYGEGKKYPHKVRCHWRFQPILRKNQKFKHFEFRFNDFDVPSRPKCVKAGLKFTYFDKTKRPESGVRYTFCNDKKPPSEKPIVMKAPVVEIEFESAVLPRNAGRGFEFEFKVILDEASKKVTQPKHQVLAMPKCGLVLPRFRSQKAIRGKSYRSSRTQTSNMVRIVGGNVAPPGRWRWPVHLVFQGGKVHCGSSIIYPRWLLTAAHCFGDPGSKTHQLTGWDVFVGRHAYDQNQNWNKTKIFKPEIQDVFVHANYSLKSRNKIYDIALVKLKERISMADQVATPVCLPSRDIKPGRNCVVMGWGSTKGTGGQGYLKEATVPVMDVDLCKSMNQLYSEKVNPLQNICAGFEEGKVDACTGDSGGALACKIRGKYEVQGIVSWGKGCAGKKAPGVYTKVYYFLDWITEIVLKHRKD